MANWTPVIINNVEGCYLENLGDFGFDSPYDCNHGPFHDLTSLVSIDLNYMPCIVTTRTGTSSLDPVYTYYRNHMDKYFECSINQNSTNLTQVYNINNDVISMYFTFYKCKKLNYLSNLPSNLQGMEGAFQYCTSLATLPNIPASVTNATRAFIGCTGLINPPTFLGNNISGNNIFQDCTNLTSTPDLSKFSTLSYAFKNCTNLTTINGNFNPNITSLIQTFYYCTSLTGVVPPIPAGVTQMREAFVWTKITSYSFSQNNSPVDMWAAFISCSDLVTADVNNATNLNTTFRDCTSLISCTGTINPNCTNMLNTFGNCTSLIASPVLPNGLLDMGSTFSGCTSLAVAPEIPANVTQMGSTFKGCTALTGNVIIRSENVANVTDIFANTTLTKYVYIPYESWIDDGMGGQTIGPSNTYNAFISAGYDENGTKEGVYLRDLATLQ